MGMRIACYRPCGPSIYHTLSPQIRPRGYHHHHPSLCLASIISAYLTKSTTWKYRNLISGICRTKCRNNTYPKNISNKYISSDVLAVILFIPISFPENEIQKEKKKRRKKIVRISKYALSRHKKPCEWNTQHTWIFSCIFSYFFFHLSHFVL